MRGAQPTTDVLAQRGIGFMYRALCRLADLCTGTDPAQVPLAAQPPSATGRDADRGASPPPLRRLLRIWRWAVCGAASSTTQDRGRPWPGGAAGFVWRRPWRWLRLPSARDLPRQPASARHELRAAWPCIAITRSRRYSAKTLRRETPACRGSCRRTAALAQPLAGSQPGFARRPPEHFDRIIGQARGAACARTRLNSPMTS